MLGIFLFFEFSESLFVFVYCPSCNFSTFAVRKRCIHGSKNSCGWGYPTVPLDDVSGHLVPDRILCILDMDNGYLAFSSHRRYYGVAFTGLKGKELYPIVSAVWGHCEITIRYLGGLPRMV